MSDNSVIRWLLEDDNPAVNTIQDIDALPSDRLNTARRICRMDLAKITDLVNQLVKKGLKNEGTY